MPVGRHPQRHAWRAAFAIPATWLIENGLLLNPAVVDALEATGGRWWEITSTITSIVIAVIVTWDAFDGFRKAYRNASHAGQPVSV